MYRKVTATLIGVMVMSAGLAGCACDEDSTAPPAQPSKAMMVQPMKPDTGGAKPAAAPAPRAGECGGIAIPTGDRNTSVVYLSRTMPSEVIAGAEFDYSISVTNLTTYQLKDVVVKDNCVSNCVMVSSTPTAQGTGPNVTWNLGALNPRETKTVAIRGKATNVGQVTSCAWATYNSELCCSTNVVQPSLALTKTAPSEVTICDPIPMELTVTNKGTGMARNVVVRDQLPAGLTTADGKTTIEQNVGNLGPNESRKVPIMVKATKTGTYANTGTAAAEGGLNAASNATSTIVRQPVLTLACKASDRIFINRNATFEFTVRNTGDAACSATVCMPLPSGATFINATDGGANAGGRVCWNVGSLAPNATKTMNVTIKPTAMSALAVTAEATCPCSPKATTNCSTQVVGIPALLLDGRDDPDPIQVGDNVVYTLTCTNQGSANLTNVQLICTMDEGDVMQFVSATGGAQTINGRTITFPAIPVLAPGTKQTYTITVKALKEGQVQFKGESKSTEITRPLVKIETTNFYK